MFEIRIQSAIDPPWLAEAPVKIGAARQNFGEPDAYFLLHDSGDPKLRVDAYKHSDEYFGFSDAATWNDHLIIGWGNHVYFIQLTHRTVRSYDLNAYFGYLYVHSDYLLVTSGEQVFRFDSTAGRQWESPLLGIDGVIVIMVENNVISGEGEWDPPGGWQPFTLDLDTGVILD